MFPCRFSRNRTRPHWRFLPPLFVTPSLLSSLSYHLCLAVIYFPASSPANLCTSPRTSPQIHVWWPARIQGWWWWMRCWTRTPTNSPSQRQAFAFSSPRIFPPSPACAWQDAWSSTRYTARAHTLHVTSSSPRVFSACLVGIWTVKSKGICS